MNICHENPDNCLKYAPNYNLNGDISICIQCKEEFLTVYKNESNFSNILTETLDLPYIKDLKDFSMEIDCVDFN